MNKDKLNAIKYYFLNFLELLVFVVICYIILESIKFGNMFKFFKNMILILKAGPNYILTAILEILSFSLIIKSFTKNNFICNIIVSILLLCITLISFYKYVALEQPFVPYDILLVGNLNQISQFGFIGFTNHMFLTVILLVTSLVASYYINKKIKDKINLTLIKRFILFAIGIVIIFITCISPNRYERFRIKNDNGDNYAWMGANAVFFMHLGDFYNPKPVRIQRRSNSKYKK